MLHISISLQEGFITDKNSSSSTAVIPFLSRRLLFLEAEWLDIHLYITMYIYLYAPVFIYCFLRAGYQTVTSRLTVTTSKEEPSVPHSLCFSWVWKSVGSGFVSFASLCMYIPTWHLLMFSRNMFAVSLYSTWRSLLCLWHCWIKVTVDGILQK